MEYLNYQSDRDHNLMMSKSNYLFPFSFLGSPNGYRYYDAKTTPNQLQTSNVLMAENESSVSCTLYQSQFLGS